MELQTERLLVIALDMEQLRLLLEDIKEFEKKLNVKYYGEPIEGDILDFAKSQYQKILNSKGIYKWHTFWQFKLKSENIIVGSASFKGSPNEYGDVDIGYSTNVLYQNKGYTTEAVIELCNWALTEKNVFRVIAETEKDNIPSQRVLEKCGMQKYKENDESFWWELKR